MFPFRNYDLPSKIDLVVSSSMQELLSFYQTTNLSYSKGGNVDLFVDERLLFLHRESSNVN